MVIQGNKFSFIRHAETEWNVRNLCQGLRDIPLSATGKEKATQFGEKTSSFSVEVICSSPLIRALDTAKCLQRFHPKAEIKIIDDLKERCWGALEGGSSERMFELEKQEEIDPDYPLPTGVEPRLILRDRIIKGINRAFEFHSHPFIVSHGRLFVSLCEVLNIPPIKQIPNLAILEFTKVDSIWEYKIMTV